VIRPTGPPVDLASETALRLFYVGQIGDDEHLLRVEGEAGSEQTTLRQKLAVIEREAEVLLWIARRKSNRETASSIPAPGRCDGARLEIRLAYTSRVNDCDA
jgi:hypothetical protein